MSRVVFALAMFAVLVLQACTQGGTEGSSADASVVPIPTQTDGFGGEDARITGVLQGDASEGCLWLEGPDGERTSVLWPPGYAAMFDPVRLVGPEGDVVANGGDQLQAGGGLYREEIPRCQYGDTVARVRGITVVSDQDG